MYAAVIYIACKQVRLWQTEHRKLPRASACAGMRDHAHHVPKAADCSWNLERTEMLGLLTLPDMDTATKAFRMIRSVYNHVCITSYGECRAL